jgi:hypothetical protein
MMVTGYRLSSTRLEALPAGGGAACEGALFDGVVAQVEEDGHVRIGDLDKCSLRASETVSKQIRRGKTSLRIAVGIYATAPDESAMSRM